MTATLRPASDEFSPAFAGYVSQVRDDEDALALLDRQLGEVVGRLGAVPEARGDYRYAPGKWTVKDVICHLSDCERIFAYRALRIARGDPTPLASFDENAYAAEAGAGGRTLADLLEEWGDVRRATLALFHHLEPDAWTRRGTASDKPISVRALAYVIAGHTRHHLRVLEERYLG